MQQNIETLGVVTRLVAGLSGHWLLEVVRIVLGRVIDQRLLDLIDTLVRESEKGDMPGEDKARWVRERLTEHGTDIAEIVSRTPPHLINLALEGALSQLRAGQRLNANTGSS